MNAREQWLAERRTGIGGSDVAAILGLSRWRTPLDVYRDKLGESDAVADNDAMRWGRYLEPAVRQAYSDTTGLEVRVPDKILRHKTFDFMLANVDGLTEDKRVLEIKTARSANGWGEDGSAEIPQAYLLQVQHYMLVTGYRVADVAVLIGGSDFRIYEVQADDELQTMLLEEESAFWLRVQAGNPPEPISFADATARYGRGSLAASVTAEPHVVAAIETLRAIDEQLSAIEASKDHAKTIVANFLGERDTLLGPGGETLCTWKAAKPAERLDGAALEAKHPEIYAQYLKLGAITRRFLLK